MPSVILKRKNRKLPCDTSVTTPLNFVAEMSWRSWLKDKVQEYTGYEDYRFGDLTRATVGKVSSLFSKSLSKLQRSFFIATDADKIEEEENNDDDENDDENDDDDEQTEGMDAREISMDDVWKSFFQQSFMVSYFACRSMFITRQQCYSFIQHNAVLTLRLIDVLSFFDLSSNVSSAKRLFE